MINYLTIPTGKFCAQGYFENFEYKLLLSITCLFGLMMSAVVLTDINVSLNKEPPKEYVW